MRRHGATRLRSLLGWAAIGLALAWSASAHLLWQVETRTGKDRSSAVRLVVSALTPSTHAPCSEKKEQKDAPRAATQPVLPDGETPAPCQVRRSFSPDVEVLPGLDLSVLALPAEAVVSPGLWRSGTPPPLDVSVFHGGFVSTAAALPRPPPGLA